MNNEIKKGGRGECSTCGQYHNNVSYHEEHECKKNLPSRINPEYLTPEKLKEASSKIKWDDEFYKDFLNKLPKLVESKIRNKNESLGEVLYKKHHYKMLIYILILSSFMALLFTIL